MWESLDWVDIDVRVPPRDAALEVDDWGHNPNTHHILADIYRALHGPGILRDGPAVAVPLADVLERIKRGLIIEELVLFKAIRPTPSLIVPVVPPPVVPPPVVPPPRKTWIKIKVVHADGTLVQGLKWELSLPARPRPDRGKTNPISKSRLQSGQASIWFPMKAPAVKPGKRPKRPTTRTNDIEIDVLHEDGTPVVGRKWVLTLPDGTEKTDTLRIGTDSGTDKETNTIKVETDEPGNCSIAFPWSAAPVAHPGKKPPGELPVMPAGRWSARWDSEQQVKLGQRRTMVFSAPDVPRNTPVKFKLRLTTTSLEGEVLSKDIAERSVPCQGTTTTLAWSQWFEPEWVLYTAKIVEGSTKSVFPAVTFTFSVSVSSRAIDSSNDLQYNDTIYAKIHGSTEEEDSLLKNQEYVLLGPWGTYLGKTDSEGCLRVENLPPGGTMVLIDGVVVNPVPL